MWSDSSKSLWQWSSSATLKMRIFNADFFMVIPEPDLKGKKSCCCCRTSTLLVFYRFEQSSLHSLKREILQCFKAFLLLYHFYYHFKVNFLIRALVILWSWSLPTACFHQITPGVICPLQEESVLCLRDKLFSAALHLATAKEPDSPLNSCAIHK